VMTSIFGSAGRTMPSITSPKAAAAPAIKAKLIGSKAYDVTISPQRSDRAIVAARLLQTRPLGVLAPGTAWARSRRPTRYATMD
jgi:hypothetical protein